MGSANKPARDRRETKGPHMARILVVDDFSSVREFVRRALEHAGHDVVASTNGLEGLETLAGRGPFDLLLADIAMPGLDGIELAREAAGRYPRLRILLMTGYSSGRQKAKPLPSAFHGVISKPFTLKEICQAVDEALHGERDRSPEGAP